MEDRFKGKIQIFDRKSINIIASRVGESTPFEVNYIQAPDDKASRSWWRIDSLGPKVRGREVDELLQMPLSGEHPGVM